MSWSKQIFQLTSCSTCGGPEHKRLFKRNLELYLSGCAISQILQGSQKIRENDFIFVDNYLDNGPSILPCVSIFQLMYKVGTLQQECTETPLYVIFLAS